MTGYASFNISHPNVSGIVMDYGYHYELADISHAVFAIIVGDESGPRKEQAGTGFAIAKDKNRIYALTATHVLEALYKQADLDSSAYERKQRMSHLGSQEPLSGNFKIRANIIAIFEINGSAKVFKFAGGGSTKLSDISLVILVPHDGIDDVASTSDIDVLGLSLHSNNIGPDLVLLGVEHDETEMSFEMEPDGGYSFGARFRVAYETGKLMETRFQEQQQGGLAKGMTFITDITIDPGMSGGPIVGYPTLRRWSPTMRAGPFVVGVASTGSPGGGYSICTSVYEALNIKLAAEGDETILDWVRSGKIQCEGGIP